jgi:hypothetical protein
MSNRSLIARSLVFGPDLARCVNEIEGPGACAGACSLFAAA